MNWGYLEKENIAYNTQLGMIVKNSHEKLDKVKLLINTTSQKKWLYNMLINLEGVYDSNEIKKFIKKSSRYIQENESTDLCIRIENYKFQTNIVKLLDTIDIVLKNAFVKPYFFLELSNDSILNEELCYALKRKNIIIGVIEELPEEVVDKLEKFDLICIPILTKEREPENSKDDDFMIDRSTYKMALEIIKKNFIMKIGKEQIYNIETIVVNKDNVECFSVEDKINQNQYKECLRCSLSGCCTETIHRICKGNNTEITEKFQSWILEKSKGIC